MADPVVADPSPAPAAEPDPIPISVDLAPIAVRDQINTKKNAADEIIFSGDISGKTVSQSIAIIGTCLIMYSPKTENFYTISLPRLDSQDIVYGLRHAP